MDGGGVEKTLETPSAEPAPDRLDPDIDDLRRRAAELEFERDGYYGEWQHAKNQLAEIHSSKMWRLWMMVHSVRYAIRHPLTVPRRIFRAVSWRARHAARALANGLAWCGRTIKRGFSALGGILSGAGRGLFRVAGGVHLYLWAWKAKVGARLRGTPDPPHGVTVDTETIDLKPRRPRVLIVSPYPLYPPNHGSATRTFNLIKELAADCDLYLLIFTRTGDDPVQLEGLGPYCHRIDFHHWIPRAQSELLELNPPGARLFASDQAETKIRDIVLGNDIDIVQLEHTELGQFASVVPKRAKVILSEIDIAFLTHERRRELRFNDRYEESRAFGSTRTDLNRLLRFEVRCARAVDHVHTMSAVDGAALARYLPTGSQSIRVIPNGVSADDFNPPTAEHDRRDVLFIGNFGHLPNVDALEYLVTDIWPLLRLSQSDARLSVVGANADDRVHRFAGAAGITVVGEVPDTRPSYHAHRVMVAPIRAGSGTRLKILEAFAAGTPVVSTSLGAEGLGAEHGTHLLLADEPADFARAVDRLLTDDALHSEMAESAQLFVRDNFDWPKVAARSLAAYAELMAESATEDHPTSIEPVTQARSIGPPTVTSCDFDASIVIPTLNGGADLDKCLERVRQQESDLQIEILCVDSGSTVADIRTMHRWDARVHPIDRRQFNHGLTRDLGARLTTGRTIVFLNQDAIPADEHWLERLIAPFDSGNGSLAAVQGGIAEVPNPDDRFFWDSCGHRFYFTSESDRWISDHGGIGFSTVNCAILREVWDRYPFGWAAIMEDKKWQREVTQAGFEIAVSPEALVHHTHQYPMRSLLRRCTSEGYGWRTLGEPYSLGDMAGDMANNAMLRDLLSGIRKRRIRSTTELFFPWLRPAALYWGNHIARDVKL